MAIHVKILGYQLDDFHQIFTNWKWMYEMVGHQQTSMKKWLLTWRIIPVSKWLGSAPFISHEFSPFGRGITRSLGDLRSPWLLTTF